MKPFVSLSTRLSLGAALAVAGGVTLGCHDVRVAPGTRWMGEASAELGRWGRASGSHVTIASAARGSCNTGPISSDSERAIHIVAVALVAAGARRRRRGAAD